MDFRRLLRVAASVLLACTLKAQSPEQGQQLFDTHCLVCHGAFAEGGSAPDLTNPRWQQQRTDEQLDSAISNGVPGTAMPAFAQRIDQAGRRSLVALLRSFTAKAIQPATEHQMPDIRVPPERLLTADQDPSNWLMYGLDYGQTRYSRLSDVDRSNVQNG